MPKTAGISVSNLLLAKATETTFFSEIRQSMGGRFGVHVEGVRHETLFHAEAYFRRWNKSILDFEKILVTMRNPYDMDLSQYSYFRKVGHEQDVGPEGRIALNHTFREYLETAPFKGEFPPRLDKFFHVLGKIPPNLAVLRFERLNEDLRRHASPFLTDVALPHDNRSEHLPYEEIFDAQLEELCYRRNRWFFDNGYYPRLQF